MNERNARNVLRLLCVMAALGLVLMGTFAKRGLVDWRRMIERNEELAAKLDVLQREKAGLERRTAALQSDPAEQERVIRDALGYVRPDETVIEFP